MANNLDDHHVAMICQVLQQQLAVTFDKYGQEAGSQIQIMWQS